MDAPSEAPHHVAGKAAKGAGDATKQGLNSLKKLPPWALLAIGVGVLIVVMYMRHQSATSSSSQNASASSTDTTGTAQDTADASGSYSDGGYSSGYEAGLAQGGITPSSGYGGGGAYDPVASTAGLIGSLFPNGIPGASAPGAGTSAPPNVTVNFPSGGGPPKRGKDAHAPHKPHGRKPTHTGIRVTGNPKGDRARRTTTKRKRRGA